MEHTTHLLKAKLYGAHNTFIESKTLRSTLLLLKVKLYGQHNTLLQAKRYGAHYTFTESKSLCSHTTYLLEVKLYRIFTDII